jgi:MFS family permease
MPLLARVIARDFDPDYRRLWSASALTNLGDGVLEAAGPLLIASLTSQPALVGAAVVVQQLPWLLFALLSGALADRWDRRRLVVLVNICRATAMGLLTATIVAGWADLALVYLALFLLGTGETLADTAGSALVVQTVTKSQLGDANARLVVTSTIGNQLAGPPLGALLFTLGHAYPAAFQTITYAGAAILLARMTSNPGASAPGAGERSTVWADIRTGLTWLLRHRALRTLLITSAAMNITFMAAFATWVLYATELLGLSEVQFGLLTICSAIGGLAGPWAYARVAPTLGAVGILRLGFAFEGLVHLVLATHPTPWIVAVTMLLFGIHTVVCGAAETTVQQHATPIELLGRTHSVFQLASMGGVTIGAALGAILAQHLGLTAGFWLAGTSMLAIAVLAWRPLAALQT